MDRTRMLAVLAAIVIVLAIVWYMAGSESVMTPAPETAPPADTTPGTETPAATPPETPTTTP